MFSLPRISKLRLPPASRRYSNVAVKLWHRSEFNRLKNDGMMITSENVLTSKCNKELSTTNPTASIPTRLQVTVPRKIYNANLVFEQHSLEEGTLGKHFVGENAYSANMMQYAKATDAPGPPQGEQGFLWRLTRPFEAFKKRFMGNEEFSQETKAKAEPIKATPEEAPSKSPVSPPKSP